eukprot:11213386-Lingulodinium_polyedra.AAC.1
MQVAKTYERLQGCQETKGMNLEEISAVGLLFETMWRYAGANLAGARSIVNKSGPEADEGH